MLFESMLAIGAVLLIGSGGSKLFDRAPTRGALKAAGLPAGELVVALLAIVEIAIGMAVLLLDHPLAALALAGIHLAFAAFVVHAQVKGIPIRSCGCFGRADTPPTAVHVVVNLTLSMAGVVVAANGSLASTLAAATPFEVLGTLAMAGIGAYVMYLLLTELPATMRAVRGNP